MILKVHLCCREDQLPIIQLSVRPSIWHVDEGALQQSSTWAATVMATLPPSKSQCRKAWYDAFAASEWRSQDWRPRGPICVRQVVWLHQLMGGMMLILFECLLRGGCHVLGCHHVCFCLQPLCSCIKVTGLFCSLLRLCLCLHLQHIQANIRSGTATA